MTHDLGSLLWIAAIAIALAGMHLALLGLHASGGERTREAPGIAIVLGFALLVVVGSGAPWFLHETGVRTDSAVRICALGVSALVLALVGVHVTRIPNDRIDFYYGAAAVLAIIGSVLNLLALLAGVWPDPWQALLVALGLSLVVVFLQIVKSMIRIAQRGSGGGA